MNGAEAPENRVRVLRRALMYFGGVVFAGEFTTLKDRKKEVGRDLFVKMCRDLKIDPHEL
jgi:hypothetical protein